MRLSRGDPGSSALEGGSPCSSRRWEPALRFGIVLALCFAVYFPALTGTFQWDDAVLVKSNLLLRSADGLRRIWFTADAVDYLPVTQMSFWVEWRLWGESTTGYHATNVALHAVCAWMAWETLLLLGFRWAWAAAALFALHPVNVPSVAWIAERKNVLSGAFLFLTLWTYLRYDDTRAERWYGASLVLFLLALLSKGAVVAAPLAFLVVLWFQHGRLQRSDVVRTLPFLALSLVLGLVTVWFQQHNTMEGRVYAMPDLGARLLNGAAALWFYLGKALVPVGLCTVYPGWDVAATGHPSALPLIVLAGCAALLFRYRGTWGRPILTGLGCWAVMLLPTLGVIPMYLMQMSLVWDHMQYHALLGVIALAVGLSFAGARRFGRHLPAVLPAAGVLVMLLLGLHTWQRAGLYRDGVTLWTEALETSPRSWVTHANLGWALDEAGDFAAALPHKLEFVRLNPQNPGAHANLGYTLMRLDRCEEAIPCFDEALRLLPGYIWAQEQKAVTLIRMGRYAEAESLHLEMARARPRNAVPPYNLGNLLVTMKRYDEAAEAFRRAAELDLYHIHAHANRGRVLAALGRIPEAEAEYRKALALDRNNAVVLRNLAWLLACHEEARYRKPAEAVALAERADRLSGGEDLRARDTLAAAYAAAGRFAEAAALAESVHAQAQARGWRDLAEHVRARLELYRQNQPIRLGPGIPIE